MDPAPPPAPAPARVLVVDDDRASRDLMAKILRQEGYQVEVASDGAEAIAKAKAGPAGIPIDRVSLRFAPVGQFLSHITPIRRCE